jgi:hypothetical protein
MSFGTRTFAEGSSVPAKYLHRSFNSRTFAETSSVPAFEGSSILARRFGNGTASWRVYQIFCNMPRKKLFRGCQIGKIV